MSQASDFFSQAWGFVKNDALKDFLPPFLTALQSAAANPTPAGRAEAAFTLQSDLIKAKVVFDAELAAQLNGLFAAELKDLAARAATAATTLVP